MNPALFVLVLVASQTAAPAAAAGADPSPAVAVLAGGSAAATGAILSGGVGLMFLASTSFTVQSDLVGAMGVTALIVTPLVTALAAGVALNLLYGGDCQTYVGVVVGSMMACMMAYACAAAVAAIPLLLLGGSGGGCGNGCGGCNAGDPCGSFADWDIVNPPREEVIGGMFGAGIGLAVGAVVGAVFPFAFVESGGNLPNIGLLGTNQASYALALGAGMGVVLAGVGSAIGVGVSLPEKKKKKTTGEKPKTVQLTYEIPPDAAPDAAMLLAY